VEGTATAIESGEGASATQAKGSVGSLLAGLALIGAAGVAFALLLRRRDSDEG
jgi:hypothetical protein